MHLTPSAVSQQVRQLAAEVGVALLERDGRSVRLTPAALRLLEYSHLTAAAWEAVLSDLEEMGSDGRVRGPLPIGGFATAIPSLIVPAAAEMTTNHPDVELTVRETNTADSLTLLLQEAVDVAVIAAPGIPAGGDPRFEQRTLVDDPQDLVVALDSAILGRDAVQLNDLAQQRWIEPHIDQRRLIEAACAMEGFGPNFTHQADDWNAVLAMVASGMGVCLYPRMSPIGNALVRRVSLAGSSPPVRRVLTCIRSGSARRPAIAAYMACLDAQSGSGDRHCDGREQ